MKLIKYLMFIIILCIGFEGDLFSWMEKSSGRKNNTFGVSTGFLYPAGKLGEMSKPGYGGVLSYTYSGIFFKNFICGLESGFYSLKGKATSDEAELETDRIFIVPLLVTSGYKIPVTRKLFIIPSISAGAAYFNATYSQSEKDSTDGKEGSDDFWDADMKAGIGMTYFFSNCYIGISGDYGIFTESDYINRFYSGSVLFGYSY